MRLVAHAAEAISPYTPQAISRTRKKLLAEIALSDDEITLDGVTYTRNDVMSLLDGITDERGWQHHCTVYAHEPLLRFLEQEQFDGEGMKAVDNLLYSPYFVAFVSPYFSYAFNNVSNALLKDEDYASLDRLLDYRSFIAPEHSEDAYQRIRIYLDDLVHTLKNLGWEKFRENELVLGFVFDSHWIVFMNKLPSSFDVTRDEVVGQMLVVVERFQRKATWYYLDQVCIRLQQVHCGPTTHAEVNRFQGIMHQNAMVESKRGKVSSSSGSGNGGSWVRGIFWAIWIVLAIIRAGGGCNRSSHNYDYSSSIASYQNSEFYQELQSSVNERKFKTFLANLNREPHEGEEQAMKNATTPFPNFSTLPLSDGEAKFELKNETAGDLLLFYFVNNNQLVSEYSKPYAVYIKKGGSYTFYFRPNYGRFNMVFGKDWKLVKEPFLFRLNKNRVDEPFSDRETENKTAAGSWRVYNYFGTPALSQPFLNSDLTIMDMEQHTSASSSAPAPSLLYAPEKTNQQADKAVRLRVQENSGAFTIKPGGTLYVYKGPEQGG